MTMFNREAYHLCISILYSNLTRRTSGRGLGPY